MREVRITKDTSSSRDVQYGGHTFEVFEAEYVWLHGGGKVMLGINIHIPPGADWRAFLKSRGITQDPTTKLLHVPINQLPATAERFETDGMCTCAVYPDNPLNINELHVPCAEPEMIERFQREAVDPKLALTL